MLENGDPNDVDVLCERAEAHLVDEDYDAAIEDYRKAHEANEGSQKAREGLDRAQKLKKQAGKRDYYKILGVKRWTFVLSESNGLKPGVINRL